MKKLLILGFCVFLAGCGLKEIQYEGKTMPVEDVEEIVENKLELENPHLDINVDISEELDD